MAMLVISVPLSETIFLGFPRLATRLSSSRASLAPDRDVSAEQAQAFAGEVVDDGQNPKAATAGEGIADEVQAPALIGT
jgi:hypothetical protein